MKGKRRAQSSGNRTSSTNRNPALKGGYTMYNQSGQKFHLPNPKMASGKAIQQLEIRAKGSFMHPVNTEVQTFEKKLNQSTLDYSSGNAAVMLGKSVNYRVAQPYSSTLDVNNKLWEMSKKTTKGLKRISSACPKKEETHEFRQSEITLQSEPTLDKLDKGKRPYEFLSSLGGRMMSTFEDVSTQKEIQISSAKNETNKRPQTVSTIARIDFTSIINETKIKQGRVANQKPPISKRPQTSAQFRTVEVRKLGNQRIQSAIQSGLQSATIDVNRQESAQIIESELDIPIPRPQSNWSMSRPISAKTAAPQHFFQKYVKFTNMNALEQPYEELFDRNERTIAATFAKFGDLGYYSPIQRIGAYMQFAAKLKLEHLIKIIDLQKTISQSEKLESEIPIQLAIVNELNPSENRDKTGINSGADDAYTREPVSLSLFPEYFEDNDENISQMELAMRKFQDIVDEMGGNYDPALLGKQFYIYINSEDWPDRIKKEVCVSIERYNHYINSSEQIRNNEVPKFKKEWIVNACNLIPEDLLQKEEQTRKLFQEIFELFKIAMKRSMLDYILRSPQERKRLHITLIPRQFIHSGQRIGREGGYNMRLFPEWHEFVDNGREYCENHLHLISTNNSALTDWFQDFQNFKLCDLDRMVQVSKLGYTFTLPEFQRVQTIYKLNIICLLENIWYRGVMTIIKAGKFLRQRDIKTLWTATGPKIINRQQFLIQNDESLIYHGEGKPTFLSINRAMEFLRQKLRLPYLGEFKDSCQALSAFYEYYLQLDNPSPQQIHRISESPLQELQYLNEEKFYKSMEKEEKKIVIQNVTIQIQLQLRQIVERSLEHFENILLKIPVAKESQITLTDHGFQDLIEAYTSLKDREFQMPQWSLLKEDYHPFIKINLVIENGMLKMRESDDLIKTEFSDIIRNIITSFDKFLNPKYSKLIQNSDEQGESVIRDLQFNFDIDMGGMTKEDFQKFFKQFWPNIRVEEKQQKEHPELLLASEEQRQSIQEQKCLQVASPGEPCFQGQESKIVKHVFEHFKRCSQVENYFDQFSRYFDKDIEKEIRSVISKKVMTNDEFKQYMEILTKYENHLSKFELFIQFPIFQVNCEFVIRSLKQSISECKEKVFNKYEQQLIDASKILSDRYIQISTYIRKSLKTPEDVEAMDKYVADVQNERILIKSRTLEIFQRVLFLIKQDYTISDTLLQLSEELHHRPSQLERELNEQEEKHQIERQRLEEDCRKQRREFEELVLQYCDEVHNFETFTEKSKYKSYILEIQAFEKKLEEADQERIEINVKENTLFGYQTAFENFDMLQKNIQPFSELWKSLEVFMEYKRKWQKLQQNIDEKEVGDILKECYAQCRGLLRRFKQNSIPYRVTTEYKEDIEFVNQSINEQFGIYQQL